MLPIDEFNFDLLARLANNAPEEFSRQRELLIKSAIVKSCNPNNAMNFQSEIDSMRLQTALGEDTYLIITNRLSELAYRFASLTEELKGQI